MNKKGQSLIEFVIVLPLLLVVVLGIFELAMFWRTSHTVQQIALEAAVIASGSYIPYDGGPNTAGDKAASFVVSRMGSLGKPTNISMTKSILDNASEEPFAAYQYTGGTAPNGGPLVTLVVDYRNPINRGVITQLTYNYRTMLVGAEFQVPGGRKIVILPRDIPISSTKIQQYNTY